MGGISFRLYSSFMRHLSLLLPQGLLSRSKVRARIEKPFNGQLPFVGQLKRGTAPLRMHATACACTPCTVFVLRVWYF